MKELFDKFGAYNYRSFKGENGTWTIVGSESQGEYQFEDRFKPWEETSIALTIDQFRSEKGLYTFYTRGRILEFFEAKQITPVPGTEVSTKAEEVKKEIKKVTKKR